MTAPRWHQQRSAGNRQLRQAAEVVQLADYRPPPDPTPDDLARAHLADMAQAYAEAGDHAAAVLCDTFARALESR